MRRKVFKILFGLALLPFCAGFTWQFASALASVRYRPVLPYAFLGGCLAYLAVHLLFRRPVLAYVFGHELTHALFAMLFGGSVKSFHASERGGRVTITKSNFLITLAPYFFPVYTFLVLLALGAARYADARTAEPWLVFLAGGTYMFHLALTFIFLQADQDDIREHGAVFSYPLIYLFNILFASLLIRLLLAESMDYPKFLMDGIIKSTGVTVLVATRTWRLFVSPGT